MNRLSAFSGRVLKEILRDPLDIGFGIGFPVVLMLLLSAIQSNIPVALFEIAHLTPGIVIFGLSFLTLFSSLLIAKDRRSALLHRLYTTPMRSPDFILGYTLPLIPLALAQAAVCYLLAMILGLVPTVQLLLVPVAIIPCAWFYISLGLLCGSALNDKQVGGVCGALLTNLSAWLSGTWFDLELVGGAFRKIAYLLPFVHAVDLLREAQSGTFAAALPHLLWVLGYSAAVTGAAVALFLRQSRKV